MRLILIWSFEFSRSAPERLVDMGADLVRMCNLIVTCIFPVQGLHRVKINKREGKYR